MAELVAEQILTAATIAARRSFGEDSEESVTQQGFDSR
jgi:hypothetical protein